MALSATIRGWTSSASLHASSCRIARGDLRGDCVFASPMHRVLTARAPHQTSSAAYRVAPRRQPPPSTPDDRRLSGPRGATRKHGARLASVAPMQCSTVVVTAVSTRREELLFTGRETRLLKPHAQNMWAGLRAKKRRRARDTLESRDRAHSGIPTSTMEHPLARRNAGARFSGAILRGWCRGDITRLVTPLESQPLNGACTAGACSC